MMEEVKRETTGKEVVNVDNTTHTPSINNLNLIDSTQRTQLEVYLKSMIGSDKSGIKSIADGIAIYNRAQDLNLPFTGCIEHIHVINGKTGIDIHLIKALLARAGITWVCNKEYVPQYEYTDGNNVYNESLLPDYCLKCKNAEDASKVTTDDIIGVYPVRYYSDYNGNIYKHYQLNGNYKQVAGVVEAKAVAAEGKTPIYRIPSIAIDYVTEYVLTRILNVKGKEVIQTSKGTFSYSEAMVAELFKKDTYTKYAKTLIGHRAFSYAARDIASDILFGCMETTELKIVSGQELNDADVIEITEYQ